MTEVLLSLGSNINAGENIIAGVNALREQFGDVQLSPVYESEAVGFDGENFYNLVAVINTALSVGELQNCLHKIEDNNGRVRGGVKFSARTLDIDILTYGDLCGNIDGVQLPRGEILKNAFVLLPMQDIRPNTLHPRLGQSYQSLWQAYDKKQVLWQVALAL